MEPKFLVIFLLAGLALIPLGTELAYAQIEQGKNYDSEFLGFTPDGNMQFKWVSHPERIPDYVDQKGKQHYADYKWYEDQTSITFESATISFSFSKEGCGMRIYDAGRIQANQPAVVEWYQVLLKQAPNGTMDWTDSAVNSVACVVSGVVDHGNGITFNSTKQNSDGIFNVMHYVDYSSGYEDSYEYTNTNEMITDTKYGYTVVLNSDRDLQIGNINIQRDLIRNEIVLDRETIQNKQVHIKTGTRDLIFDPKNLAHDTLYLQRAKPTQDVFDFTNIRKPLLPNERLIVDPTFILSSPTVDGYVNAGPTTGTTCPATVNTIDTTNTVLYVNVPPQSDHANCFRGFAEFDISSIPAAADIVNSTFSFEIVTATNPVNCDYIGMTARPSTATNQQIWDSIGADTVIVNNDNACTTTGTDKIIDLGSSGDSYIEGQLASGWASIGIKLDVESRGGSVHNIEFASEENASPEPAPTLTITWTLGQPNPPSGFGCESIGVTVSCSWNASTPISGASNTVSTYFLGRSLDNSTYTNKTSLGNVTNVLDTNFWRINQLYHLNLTASDDVFNSTSVFTSVTTDNIPDAPQAGDTEPTAETAIRVRWNPPLDNGGDAINGYGIRYFNHTAPAGWQTLVANTTTTTLNYNFTGLHSGHTYTFGVNASNGVGSSLSFSGNMTATTWTVTDGNAALELIDTIGDTAQLNVTTSITTASPSPVTLSQFDLYANNTLAQSFPQSIQIPEGGSNETTIWFRMTDPANTYDIHIKAIVSTFNGTISLGTGNVTDSQEYDPDYINAIVSSQGDVAPVGSGGVLKVNRINVPGNSTWQIECFFKEWSTVFLNSTDGSWINTTNVGAFKTQSPTPALDTYATCYNDDLLFLDVLVPGNFTNYIIPGLVIFDQLGGFLGAPSVLLFILAIFSWGTGRNFPIVIVIGVSALGIMAALGLLLLSGAVWGIILAIAGLAIFGIRKFF